MSQQGGPRVVSAQRAPTSGRVSQGAGRNLRALGGSERDLACEASHAQLQVAFSPTPSAGAAGSCRKKVGCSDCVMWYVRDRDPQAGMGLENYFSYCSKRMIFFLPSPFPF